MKFSSHPFILSAGLLAPLVVTGLVGCGGGGGGGSSNPNPTPRPTASPTPSGSCNNSTYTPNYAGNIEALQHWPGFPLRVFLNDTDSRTRALTIRGFNQWVTATNNRVRYTLVDNAGDADITVRFGLLTSGSNQLGVTTVYYFQGQTTIQSAEIQFYYYPTNTTQVSDVDEVNQSVAAHEFGHALGIGGHSPNTADLMYPNATGGLEEVTTRDLNTLRTAYCDNFPARNNVTRQQGGVLLKRVIVN